MKPRIGMGFDVHRLVPDRELWLCGILIDWHLGLLGHSDADVAIHALIDALLGAAAMHDIGYHFPDSDERWRGADSKMLLQTVCGMLQKEGFAVGNVDVTLCLESPKLKPHIQAMRECLASCLAIPVGDVSVKATTTERLGFSGRGEGIAAYAVAMIFEQE
jgi:2-C-methyl-D-erythritol 2,4-cyclodiphosphate synthase